MQVKVKKLRASAVLPAYETPGAACFDIRARAQHQSAHEDERGVAMWGGGTRVFETGLAFEIPEGHVMLVFSRSGHGFKHATRLANCVGVIDSDYRGELLVKLHCDKDQASPATFIDGDRVAQGLVLPIERVQFDLVDELGATERGTGGFGSTG